MDGDRQRRALEAIHDLAQSLHAQLDRQSVFQSIVRTATELLEASAVGLFVKDPERPALVRDVAWGEMPEELLLHDDHVACQAFREARTMVRRKVAPAGLPGGATAATPIEQGARPRGVLMAVERPDRAFDPAAIRLLQTLGWLGGMALGSAEMALQSARREARSEAMQAVVRELVESHDLADIMNRAVEAALSLFAADRAGVWLLEPDGALRPVATRELSPTLLRAIETKHRRSLWPSVLLSGRPVQFSDVDTTRIALREDLLREGIRSGLIIPLLCRGQVIGALTVYHDMPWTHTEEDLALAGSLGQQLGIAATNARLVAETSRQLARVSMLSELGRAGVETLDLQARCDRATRALVRAGEGDVVGIYVIDGAGTALVRVSHFPDGTLEPPLRIVLTEDSMCTRAVAAARAVSTDEPDIPPASRRRFEERGIGHALTMPLVHRGKVVGLLLVGRRERSFDAGDAELLRAAAQQIAAATEHARVFSQLSEANARLLAILRCAPEGVLVFGPDHRVVQYNEGVLRIYGLEGQSILGWGVEDFTRNVAPQFADPDVPRQLARRLSEDARRLWRMEFELLRPVRRIVERVSAPVLGETGQILGQVVVFHDITALRDAQSGQRPLGRAESRPGPKLVGSDEG